MNVVSGLTIIILHGRKSKILHMNLELENMYSVSIIVDDQDKMS